MTDKTDRRKRTEYNITEELQINLFKMSCEKQKEQSTTANLQ